MSPFVLGLARRLFLLLPRDSLRRCFAGEIFELVLPGFGVIHQDARFRRGDGEIQGGAEDCGLHVPIAGPPEGIAHGEVHEQATWRTYQSGNVPAG